MKRRTSNADTDAPARAEPVAGNTRRVALIALLFVVAAVAIVVHSHSLFIPVFVTLLAFLKKGLAALTPKVLLLFAKNSLLIRIKQLAVAMLTQLMVLSHRPWRRRLLEAKLRVLTIVQGGVQWYLDRPLWLKSLLALVVLLLTASSGYALIAILIIPRAIVQWLQRQFWATLNKLGVTQFFRAAYRVLIPADWRHRWYMFQKWTLGRRQVRAHRQLRTAARRSRQSLQSVRRSGESDAL